MTVWRYYTVDVGGNRIPDPDFVPPPEDDRDKFGIYRQYVHIGGRNLLVHAVMSYQPGSEAEAWAFFRRAVPEMVGVLPEEVPAEMREAHDDQA